MANITLKKPTDFKIDSHVPVPAPRAKDPRYPFCKMEVGQSFLIDKAWSDNCRSAGQQFCRRTQPAWKFTVRKVSPQKYRCWRVK